MYLDRISSLNLALGIVASLVIILPAVFKLMTNNIRLAPVEEFRGRKLSMQFGRINRRKGNWIILIFIPFSMNIANALSQYEFADRYSIQISMITYFVWYMYNYYVLSSSKWKKPKFMNRWYQDYTSANILIGLFFVVVWIGYFTSIFSFYKEHEIKPDLYLNQNEIAPTLAVLFATCILLKFSDNAIKLRYSSSLLIKVIYNSGVNSIVCTEVYVGRKYLTLIHEGREKEEIYDDSSEKQVIKHYSKTHAVQIRKELVNDIIFIEKRIEGVSIRDV